MNLFNPSTGQIVEALTFDDVLLLPGYSEVLPSTVSTHIQFTKKITLKDFIYFFPLFYVVTFIGSNEFNVLKRLIATFFLSRFSSRSD